MATPEENLQPDPNPPPTWESVGREPEAIVEPDPSPVVDPPPAEPPLETPEPAPLVAEPETVREKSPAEPEVNQGHQEGDPPEIVAISGEGGKKWARRQFQDAAPVRIFDDPDKPISELGDELYKRSESRYFEHVDDILRLHADYFAQRMFGVKSYKEAKERFTQNGQPAQPTPITTASAVTLPTPTEINAMTDEEVAARFKAVQDAAAENTRKELEAKLQTEKDAFQQRLDALEGKLTSREKQDSETQFKTETNKLYDKVWDTVIEGGIRDSGLEVSKDDPPKIASLKNAAARLLRAESEPTFDKDESNRKVIKTAVEFAKRGEFSNMWREEDNLTVRARSAFESVKQSPELQAILGEIETYAKSKANPRAANPTPPAPGSSTGVTIKAPATWDEAIAQSKAAPLTT